LSVTSFTLSTIFDNVRLVEAVVGEDLGVPPRQLRVSHGIKHCSERASTPIPRRRECPSEGGIGGAAESVIG
jgi:hypothetical protein